MKNNPQEDLPYWKAAYSLDPATATVIVVVAKDWREAREKAVEAFRRRTSMAPRIDGSTVFSPLLLVSRQK